jgi:hypothetical protein
MSLRKALENFVDCVDATGGIVADDDGNVAPRADEDWTDLGDAYLEACKALGRKPRELP